MTKVWNQNIFQCPINKRVHFLINYAGQMFECVGTLTTNMYRGMIIRGLCLEGSETVFYNGDIIAWASYMDDKEINDFYDGLRGEINE